jgi:hypothetical protein
MKRRLVIALACATIAMGGCATWMETNDNASASPAVRLRRLCRPTPSGRNQITTLVPAGLNTRAGKALGSS